MARRGESIYKRKDNRWEGRYIKCYDILGKAQYASIYGNTYFEVKKKLYDIGFYNVQNIIPDGKHEISFRVVFFLWIQDRKGGLKEQTYAKYLYLAEKHILPDIGMLQIKRINSMHINRLLESKSKAGRIDGKGGLSSSYIQSLKFIILSTIKYAIKKSYCKALTGDIDHLCKKKHTLEVLSVEEQSTLIKYALSDKQNEKNLGTILSLFTGMRIGEVCGLMWDDIDLCNATIHVCHTVERIKNTESNPSGSSTKLILCDVKTYSSDRIIPIPSKLVQILSVYKADSKSRFVLGGTRYEYTDPRAFQYAFRRLLKNCNLRDINYHVLRHTFATRCIEVGVDIKSLSEILGHASVNITLNTYVHSSMELKRIQIEKLKSIYGQ